jgi:hypothetical protein
VYLVESNVNSFKEGVAGANQKQAHKTAPKGVLKASKLDSPFLFFT